MNTKIFLLLFLNVLSQTYGKIIEDSNVIYRNFPDQFFFGVSTAAYQIEGAWNTSGKGASIWDYMTHTKPEVIMDRKNGDVACDSYNQYERDIELLKELGVDFYRFSISWSRLLPSGFTDNINPDGLKYYNNLINGLLDNNIIPFVTLYHWDLPQNLQNIGGWTNPLMAQYFEDYARVVFENFGDRVSQWVTFNEPKNFCLEGYGRTNQAPAINSTGIGEYMCAHTVLQAHARTFHLYDKVYRPTQKGSIGITLDVYWAVPGSTDTEDVDAAERCIQYYLGWFGNAIFSEKGDYPEVMKDRIAENSKAQGFPRSRLPVFTDFEISALKGSSDFLGLNFYSAMMVKNVDKHPAPKVPSYDDDLNILSYHDPAWPGSASNWLKVVPSAFRKILKKIRIDYNNPEVIITENGFSTRGGINDDERIHYIMKYLNALLDAIEDGSNVSAYTYWSLMDNFEWMKGYTEKFGLFEVNFLDKKKKRTARASAKYFAEIIKSRSIEAFDTCGDCVENSLYTKDYNAIIV